MTSTVEITIPIKKIYIYFNAGNKRGKLTRVETPQRLVGAKTNQNVIR